VVVAAVLLTMLGQLTVGRLDLRGVFDPAPGPEHLATFPVTMPLGGAAFVAMLQLTLVCEGWPLRRLPRFAAGVAALVVSWAVALALYLAVAEVDAPPGSGLVSRAGALTGGELGALLVLVGMWQVWFFVIWRGWPFAALPRRWQRLVAGNIVVLGGGAFTYALAHGLAGVPTAVVTAVGGCAIAAGLVIGMLFEGWPRSRLGAAVAVLVLSAALYLLLRGLGGTLDWTRATTEEWVAHVGLNAIGIAVVLHVGISRRWPLRARASVR
jgi:hypothetical protein